MKTTAKWTVMVYLAGDNNLSAAGDADLAEMRAVGSSADVNIVAQFDSASAGGASRFLLERNGVGEQVESLGEIDSGDPKTLTDFIVWATDHHPAERYALVLWNHGGGWEPSEMDRIARSVGAPGYTVREANERSATRLGRVLFRTTLEKIFSRPSPAERAICSDDGSGHSLDTIELGNVLAQVVARIGRPIDLLGMDACLMSNLEVAYQARPFVRYMVASEELEPNTGWPYDVVLRKLVDHADLATDDLAAHIVHAYVQSYVDRRYPGPVTQAAVDLSKVPDIAGPLDRLAEALVTAMPEAAMEIWTAQRKSAHFFLNTLWDIVHFCEELGSAQASASVLDAAQVVRDALRSGPGNCIIASEHHGAPVDHCGGVSVYLIPPLTRISPYYGDLEFAKDHRWLALLNAYHQSE